MAMPDRQKNKKQQLTCKAASEGKQNGFCTGRREKKKNNKLPVQWP